MGIESVGQGCKGLWGATGMKEQIVACCSMRIFFGHAVPGAKKWGEGVGVWPVPTKSWFLFCTRERSCGLRKASRESTTRIGNQRSHEVVKGGARSEARQDGDRYHMPRVADRDIRAETYRQFFVEITIVGFVLRRGRAG